MKKSKFKRRVHIIGIAGVIGSSLAEALQNNNWQVSGSDKKDIYPPVSTFLTEKKICHYKGYHKKHITPDLDLVILGGSALLVDKNNPEYLKAKKLGLPIISQAQAIEKFVIRKNSIVVAGTYGKTTTTAILVSILIQARLNPSYMFGGIPKDNTPPLKITDSSWSVVEGDEYPTLFFDKRPKFWLYHPKHLILTAARWEHPDVYKTETDYLRVFKKLIDLLPKNSIIVASIKGENLQNILKKKKNVIWYSIDKKRGVDFWIEKLKLNPHGSQFEIVTKNGERIPITTSLLGKHNVENILAAAAMAKSLKISPELITQGVKKSPHLKKRLEITYNQNNITLIEDFSQTKPRIIAALQAIRDHFKKRRIILIFYPHYSGWQEKEILKDIPKAFDLANLVILTKVFFRTNKERITGSKIVKLIKRTNPNVFYQPEDEEIITFLKNNLKKGDIVIFMSSGGYRGINEKLIKYLEKGD